ncbi:MAG: DMT family transporter [Anaerolineales bacterium]|nr:DMT family transporter [Anaerolineales bacterium]
MTQSSARGYWFVVVAAALWSMIGLLVRVLHDQYGLPALAIAFLRAGVSAIISLGVLALIRRDELRVTRRGLALFVVYGAIGIGAFYWLYAQAIIQTTVTMAVVLLYTAPAFVTLIAWRAWGETLGARKVVALALAFGGCALVARAYDPAQLQLNVVGILFGVGAGFTYALFTIFSKVIVKQYAPWTALTYQLIFGALFLAPLQTWDAFAPLIEFPRAWIYLLALVLGPTLGAIWFFTAGLRSVPASNASILATLEPVLASVLAFILLGERLELLQMIGGGMVIGGVIALNLNRGQV